VSTRALRSELALYDGKHTDVLERIASEREPGAPFVRELLALARDEDGRVRSGAVWLLRLLHRDGYTFTAAQARAIVDLVIVAYHWEPRLNLLQIVAALPVAPADRARVLKALEALTEDNNGFVRAWAYSALHAHSRDDARARKRADALIARAEASETPAVRARIRQMKKKAKLASPGA